MAYQEGQYWSQFLNTMPQQLATYAQQQERTRQFDVQSKERERQFDALQGLRESADERAQVKAARDEERYKYGTGQAKLIDLLLKNQYAQNIEIAEAEQRKTKALEGKGTFERALHRLYRWSETNDEWAQRITDYDKVDRGIMDLPEGLELNPQLYQFINKNLSGYQTPLQNLLGLTLQGGGG